MLLCLSLVCFAAVSPSCCSAGVYCYVKYDVQLVKAGFKQHHICILFCFSCTKVIRSVGEEVWFYCYNQQIKQQFSHWKGTRSPHPKEKRKVSSNFETMLVTKRLLSPHFLCFLDVACVLVAFAIMRELLPECHWNSKAITGHLTYSCKITFSSGRNTGPLA